jgi:hypothetical protein
VRCRRGELRERARSVTGASRITGHGPIDRARGGEREREQVGNAERRKWSGMVTAIIFGVSTMITIAVHDKISLPAIILSKTTFALLGRWRLSFTSSATVCSRQRKTSAVTTSSVLPTDACIRLQQVSMSSTFFYRGTPTLNNNSMKKVLTDHSKSNETRRESGSNANEHPRTRAATVKYLGTRLVATTFAHQSVGESWGKFVTAGSSVPHGWGQAPRAGVRSLSVPSNYYSCGRGCT